MLGSQSPDPDSVRVRSRRPRSSWRSFRLVAVALLAWAAAGESVAATPAFEREAHLAAFFKGNTHTHTRRSDGSGRPKDVARWYKAHDYDFVVLTDHDRNGPPNDLWPLEDDSFIVIEGQELTYGSPNRSRNRAHVNGLGTTRSVRCGRMVPARAALQCAVDEIRAQGGVAQINHPNDGYFLTYDDLAAVEGAALIEVANMHPHSRNQGDARHPSVEATWDRLLTSGKHIWGVASDDTHKLPDRRYRGPRYPLPGRGWVQVAAAELTDTAILSALRDGEFYFSTGPAFDRIVVEGSTISVIVDESTVQSPRIEFIGAGGRVLLTVCGRSAGYTPSDGEVYVRVRVSDGTHRAWTQPYFLAQSD